MDKVPVVIILIIILVGVGFWAVQSGLFVKHLPANTKPTPLPSGIVWFFGDGCPHCKNVEDYIAQNNIAQKVKYTMLEVPFGGKTSTQLQSNAALAIQLAEGCKRDVSQGVGIPFLYDGNGKCYDGDQDVINFLKNAAGIK